MICSAESGLALGRGRSVLRVISCVMTNDDSLRGLSDIIVERKHSSLSGCLSEP